MTEKRELKAYFTETFVRVYQAYNHIIAESAIKFQKFLSPPFKMDRFTWIKPSFFWMMYRCDWGQRRDQERILAVDIRHEGFLWALEHGCLSHFDQDYYASVSEWQNTKLSSPVILQWDPERDINSNKTAQRTIQIGLSPYASKLYNEEWIVKISDLTSLAFEVKTLRDHGHLSEAEALLPKEKCYQISDLVRGKIGLP